MTKKEFPVSECLLVLIALAWAAFATFHPFDDDEFQHAHFAWLIRHDCRPYVDFFEHHMPGYHVLLAPIFRLGSAPWTIFVFRAVSLLCGIGTLLATYALSRRLKHDEAAAVSAVCLLAFMPMFLFKMVEARPDSPATLCLTLACLLLLGGKEQMSPSSDKAIPVPALLRLLAAGALAGIMTVFSVKSAFMALAVVICSWIVHGRKAALTVLIGSLIPAIMLAFWLMLFGTSGLADCQANLSAFYNCVLKMNFAWKHRFSPGIYLSEAFSTSGVLVVLGTLGLFHSVVQHEGDRKRGLYHSVETRDRSTQICLGRVGLPQSGTGAGFTPPLRGRPLVAPRSFGEPYFWLRPKAALGLVVVTIAVFLVIILVPIPHRQVFLPLFPLLAVGVAHLLSVARQALGQERGFKTGLTVLVIAGLVPGMLAIARDLRTTSIAELRNIQTVESVHPSGGAVFDGRGLMFYRQHVGRHACMHEEILKMLNLDRYADETIKALESEHYPTVILDYRVKQMPAAILNFISNHYRRFKDTDIYLPGIAIDRSVLADEEAEIAVPVSGLYRTTWIGGAVKIDGAEIKNGAEIPLKAGKHRFAGSGFTENLELVLVKRQ